MKTTGPRKQYTPEFKAQAIELLEVGRPVAELAAELGISANLLYAWRAGSQRPQVGSAGLRAAGEQPGADDLRALRRENALLRQENDILKKAAVILGTRVQPNSGR
ncbi:MAG: transposase [Lentisphaerae bacterium]|nr:transposase [Lentisphaerota bacterium]